MEIQLSEHAPQYSIRGIFQHNDQFQFKIGEKLVDYPVILHPEGVIPWELENPPQIQQQDLLPLLGLGVELVILGTGKSQIFPEFSVTSPILKANLGLEIMDSPAACRTYNLLLGDDRKVAVALLI